MDRSAPSEPNRLVRLARWFAAAAIVFLPGAFTLFGFAPLIQLAVGLLVVGLGVVVWMAKRKNGSERGTFGLDRPVGILSVMAVAGVLVPDAARNALFSHEPPFGNAWWSFVAISWIAFAVLAFRVVRDLGLALARRPGRLQANRWQHVALIAVIAMTWVLASTGIGMRINFALQKDSIASTFASVEGRCAKGPTDSTSMPQFRGRQVTEIICGPDQVRFTVRSWSGFFEGGNWGFVRFTTTAPPKPRPYDRLRKLDDKTQYWFSNPPFLD